MHDVRFNAKLLLLVCQESGRSLDVEYRPGLAAVPGPTCHRKQEERRHRWVGAWNRLPVPAPSEAFLREPKLNPQSSKAFCKKLEEAQGKWMSVEHFCSRWASVPAFLVPKQEGKPRMDCDPEAAEMEHVHVETKQAALDCTHAPFRQQNMPPWSPLSSVPERLVWTEVCI